MTSMYTCRWSAAKALGSPTVYPNYGDIQGAWASGNITNHEFIEVSLSFYAHCIYGPGGFNHIYRPI